MVLHNYETWMNIQKKTIKVLDYLFHYFCRTIFRIGVECPKPSFYWESASLNFKNAILEKNMNFLFHLLNLSTDTLWRQIFYLQDEDRSLPREHVDKIGLNHRYRRDVAVISKNSGRIWGQNPARSRHELRHKTCVFQEFPLCTFNSSMECQIEELYFGN